MPMRQEWTMEWTVGAHQLTLFNSVVCRQHGNSKL